MNLGGGRWGEEMLREGKMGRGGVEREKERELRLGEGEMCETRGG